MRKLSFLLLFAAISSAAFAQSSANYAFSTTTTGSLALDQNGNTVDMSTGTTQVSGPSVDQGVNATAIAIGFDFWLMGNRYSQFNVTTNGLVSLSSTGTSAGSGTYVVSGGTVTTPIISAFAADLGTGTAGKTHYKIVGTAPNRCLVIEFNNMNLLWTSSFTNDGTYQVRLYESSGVIEFVYGTMSITSTGSASDATVAIGFATNTTANNLAYVTSSTNASATTSPFTDNPTYAAGPIANLNSAADGSRRIYKYTPTVPAAPTGLNFTAVGTGGMTLNWTDAATNELTYLVFRSTDNITFTQVAQLPANSTSSTQGGLAGSTLYYWKVVAVSEGAFSTELTGSQLTNSCSLTGTYDVGPGAVSGYTTLKAAVDAAILNGVTGPVIFELNAAYTNTTDATFPIVLGAVPCASATNTITIRPAAGAGAKTITSANTTATFDVNGGAFWIIDGRQGGTGTSKDLTIENTSTSGTAFRFINDGRNNQIQYTILQGVNTAATSGVVLFSTTTGSLGNSNNTIDNCTIKDGATTPLNGVVSIATAAFPNNANTISNSNIFNFYSSTNTTNAGVGVNLGVNNTNWVISGNSFYQTASRTTFGAGSTFNAILASSNTVNGTTISGNFIGGTAPNCGGTAMTLNTTATLVFRGIQLTVGTTTATSVQGNTIQNIAVTTASTSTAQSLISAVTGNINIGNVTGNTLGSQSVTNSVTFVQSTTSTAPFFCGIIAGTGTPGVINISNNTIGGIAVSNSSTGTINVRGISFQGAATSYTVTGNTIGSPITANSITNATNNLLAGIVSNSTSATNTISNNTVVNITHTSTGTGAQVIGIITPGSTGGVQTVTGNTVRNISSGAPNVGTGSASSVIGIAQTAATTAGQTVSQNTVFSLINTNATAATNLIGIFYNGPTTGTNTIARNFVHSLNLSTSSTSGVIAGIQVGGGLHTMQNNMVRLGITDAGASITNGYTITGINDITSTSGSQIIHNSVYIGGTGVATSISNTSAFNTGTTVNTRTFRNNIFTNDRTNAAGTALHLAAIFAGTLPNPSGLTSSHNVYYSSTTANCIRNSTNNYTVSTWQSASGQDAGSYQAPSLSQIGFISATGNAATVDLHIAGATVIESSGTATTTSTDDFDGQTRAGLTPVDIGADAGNFTVLDLIAPVITYTQIPATACLTDRTLSATITDASGINVTPGTLPRLYYKKSTDANTFAGNTNADNGWKYVEASNAVSPFTFTTDFSLLQSAVAPGDVIQYFVTAQDLAATPNVGINSGIFAVAPTSVALTGTAFPIGPVINSYTLASALPTSITVGAAGNYTTLTGAAGLFADINAKYLSGNTTVTILDATIAETGANALNAINYGCSGGPFTLTIKPNTGVTTVLSGSVAGPLINLNGADNVTFDGSNNGTSSKDMTISNTNTGGSTVQFINDATGNTVKNSIILGVNSSATSGSIVFSTTTVATGNSSNTIDNNDIRDGATVPVNAIYSSGSAGGPNASNTITNNNIFNWTGSGVLVTATGNGNSWSVNSNALYQTATRTTALVAISLLSGGNSNTINNNSIGGANSTRTGTPLTSSNGISAITLSAGTTTASNIQGNLIGNIVVTSTTATSNIINVTGGNVNVGTTSGNTIGEATANSISSANSLVGIASSSSGTVDIRNNTIRNLSYNDADFERLAGIYVTAGTVTVKSNTIRDFIHTGTTNTTLTSTFVPVGILLNTTTAGNLVEDNQIFNFTLGFNGANAGVTYPMFGIEVAGVSSTGTPTVITRNKIYNLTTTRTGTTTSAPIVAGVYAPSGAATYSNNFISLTQSTASTQPLLRGVLLETTGNNNVFFNSIFIGGTAAAANNTYGLYRTSTTGTQSILNNILSNQRTGTGNHFAIGTSSVTGWNAAFSNYNDLHSINVSSLGDWGGTALTLANWKAAQPGGSGGDANSFSELPAFVSATDLHIPNATATQIESGGTPAGGITTDIDNETRPGPTNTNGGGTQVDVGADEFDGTPASGMIYVSSTTTQANTSSVPRGTTNQQVIGVEIVTSGTLSPLSATSFTLNTNGTTAPLTDITNAKLWYTGTSSTFATTTQYGSTVAAPNGSFNITGSQVLSTGTNYFWLTYDVPCGATLTNAVDAECNLVIVGEANNPTPQAPAGSRTIGASAGLSGTVTIGAAGNYPTLTGTGGLFEAINTNGISANLTANIVDAAVTEPGTVVLNTVNNVCGGPFTILIKPNTTSVLTGTVGTGAVIKLNGADNVTIDGSNSGGTDRSLTIRNTTTTTTGNAVIWLASAAASNGANSNTIKNSIIEGNSSTTSFTGIHIGGSTTIGITTAGLEANNTNTINNNLFRKTINGVTLFGFGAATPDQGNVISNNNFGTAVTGEGHSLLAINADRQSGLIVSGNEVQNVVNATNTSSTPFGGIRLLDFKNGLCFNNKVHDLAYTGTSTPKIYGIAMTNATYTTVGNPSNAQIYNNIVYRINSTGTSAVWNLTGILASAGYGDKITYNSVHLTGQLANSASGLAAAFANGDANITSVGTNIEVQNNSFSITGSSAIAGGNFWAYYTQATTLTGSVLNYNDLYAAGTNVTSNVGRFNATNYATLAAWQGATAQDANSISTDPQYNAVNNLIPQLGSPLVNAGTPIVGITTDITGFTRSVTTPTIGAYEQAGDAAAPTITYTALPFTCATADRTLAGVTIADVTGVPTTGALQPRIYFRKNAGAWFSNQGTLTTGNGISGTWDFTITAATMGGLTAGDVVQYYVIAQDLAGTPNIGSNPAAGLVATDVNTVTTAPTTPASYTISNTLSGAYTVGAAGNYTTLTAAITAYNTACLTGPVVFNLIDASYSAGETFPITINANPNASSVNTLTIKPNTGVTASISGNNATTILKLAGADYVTIDGSNNGSTSIDLTITNTGTGSVIWMGTDATAGATNNTLKNFNMVGPGAFGGQGIIAGSGATFGSAAENGRPNSNNTVQNLTAKGVQNAIFALGDATTLDDNWVITKNNFGSAVAAEKLSFRGIALQNASNFTISENKVIGVSSSTGSSSTMSGILVGATINGGIITKNEMRDIKQNNTTGWGSNGIFLNSTSTAANVTVTNNFISDVASQGFNGQDQSDNGYGLMINNGGGYQVYYNTVLMNTEQVATGGQPAALNLAAAVAAGGVNLRNNILVTTQTVGVNYSVINQGVAAAFGTINYNDYVSTENIGFQTTSQVTLTDWQTATTQDANSISVAPVFVSATDLHLVTGSNCNLHRRGTPIAGITVDYDNETRSATNPDMGADEYANSTTGTMTWTGAVSTDWFDVRNWSACEIPGPTSNVVINGSLPNYPNVTSNVTINSLTLNTGSSLTAATGVVITLLSL
ncbi:MAG: hypothetical protein NTW29_20425 [Bacteroidetes bacterium]|nr:hypothetical protein [Bacteroidota bacterium]